MLDNKKTVSQFKNRKVIVTGGAGFIGSHVAEELLKLEAKVIIIDDLSSGRIQNIKFLSTIGNPEFIQGSISDISLLKQCFSDVDYVFHLAALTSVPQSIDNPFIYNEVNVKGILNILLTAKENNVKKVVFSSSCALYGDSTEFPLRENLLPNPLSPYAVTKLVGEYYCQVFKRVYGLDTVCLRYFNVYGPRQDPNSAYAAVIPLFIKMVLSGKSPVIFGDGEQTRDFVFVKDVVSANILGAGRDASGIFNIGTGRSVTLNHVTERIVKLCGQNIEIVHGQPRVGDVIHSHCDISKAKIFGFKSEYDLDTGLKETIASIKKVAS
jgi:UDP-glucose 4-epimerase